MNEHRAKENRNQVYKYDVEGSPLQDRKFGAPVNRMARRTQSPIKELEAFEISQKVNAAQLSKKEKPKGVRPPVIEEQNKTHINDLTPRQVNIDEKSYRRRDFDMRVNNIEHISQQITGLFDYVKKNENRGTSSKIVRPTTSKADLVKNRLLQLDERKQKVDISPKKQIYNLPDSQPQYYHDQKPIQNLERRYEEKSSNLQRYQIKSKYMIEMPSRQQTAAKSTRNYPLPSYPSSTYTRKSYMQRGYHPSNGHQAEQKNEPISTTPRKYEYKFDSKQQSISNNSIQQSARFRDLETLKEQKRKRILEEYENQSKISKYREKQIYGDIDKIRQRIQSSEKRTHEMERKYLQKHNFTANPKKQQIQRNVSPIEGTMIESKVVNRGYNYAFESVSDSDPQNNYQKSNVSEFKINIQPVLNQNNHMNHKTQKQRKMIEINDQIETNKKKNIEKLSKLLQQQVSLDKALRDARTQFMEVKDQNKWKQLKRKINMKGYAYTEDQLEKQLSILPNQFDPFSVNTSSSGNPLQNLATCFIKSEKFWETELSGVISRKQVQSCEFSVGEIDLSSKGYINIEDLVCFINLHTNTFFRNRDVLTIYRRFMALSKMRQGIDMNSFLCKIMR